MPCSHYLCERYGQHREEWHEEETPMKHGEKVIDDIRIKYLCQPCPECKAKLEAAEEAIQGIIHRSDCAFHNEPAYPNGPCDCGAVKIKDSDLIIAAAKAGFRFGIGEHGLQLKRDPELGAEERSLTALKEGK